MSSQALSKVCAVGYELFGCRKNTGSPQAHLFFKQGWGDGKILNELSDENFLKNPPSEIFPQLSPVRASPESAVVEGEFLSPVHKFLPEEAKIARFYLSFPNKYSVRTPVCVLFAMTGEEGYRRRVARYSEPLLKHGIATLVLENSYYGARRPANQNGYWLNRVQDLLTMSVSSVEEGKSVLDWLSRLGFKNLAVAGVSQGGMVASVVGALMKQPLSIAAGLTAHAPEVVFTQGIMRSFVDWPALNVSKDDSKARFKKLFSGGDITLLPTPCSPQAAILQGARNDFVVPRWSVQKVHAKWPGSKLRWLPGSHISSIALHSSSFARIIRESIFALKEVR